MDWLTTPITDEAPCGPDLEQADDEMFVEYYYDAMGRLPDRYLTPGMTVGDKVTKEATVFDPKSVALKDETAQIDALLARSRDLRLLILKAQWEALAGRIEPLAASVTGIADLLEAFGDVVHPAMIERASDRREVLGDLTAQATMLMPLMFLPLGGSSDVTLRRFKVAEGKLTPIEGEDDLSIAGMRDTLRLPTSRKPVDAANAAITAILEALGRIGRACKASPAQPFSPSFEPLIQTLTEMRDVIWEARADLRVATQAAEPDPEPEDDEDAAPVASGAAASPAPPEPAADAVNSHAEARAVLGACEAYFKARLPSSPAALLVVQARLLIGRPLTEALEVLLPEQAGKATVEFGPQTGFALSMERLRNLTQQATLSEPAPEPTPEAASEPVPEVSSSGDLAARIKAVEAFFHGNERSSPVPLLLQRARSFLDKDFQQLVEELIPPNPEG